MRRCSRPVVAAMLFALTVSSAAIADTQGLAIPMSFPLDRFDEGQLSRCAQTRQSLTKQLKTVLGATNILSRCVSDMLVLQYDTDRVTPVYAAVVTENPGAYPRFAPVVETHSLAVPRVTEDGQVVWIDEVYQREHLVKSMRTTLFENLVDCESRHREWMGVPTIPVGTIAASACFNLNSVPNVLWVGLCDSLACLAELRAHWTEAPAPGPAPAPDRDR